MRTAEGNHIYIAAPCFAEASKCNWCSLVQTIQQLRATCICMRPASDQTLNAYLISPFDLGFGHSIFGCAPKIGREWVEVSESVMLPSRVRCNLGITNSDGYSIQVRQ
jgi:hypothetical protein